MASKNMVTLTLAGDSTQLEKAFSNVGASAKKMESEVGSAASGFDKMDDAAGSFERAGRGLRDAITGSTDAMKAGGAILRGDFSAETFLTAGAAVADLGGAFGDLLVPAMKNAVSWLGKTKVGMLAQAAASGVVKAATVTWTAIQWLLNAALTANPIGLIVVAIGLLVGAVVLIATKTKWFQNIWKVVWGGIKAAASAVASWFTETLWPRLKKTFDSVVNAVKSIPSKIKSAFSNLFSIITAPFRAAFNFVADAWNNTVGRLHFSIPSWVPGIGGNSISAPTLPHFHRGGVVPGAPGQEMLAVLQAGERVTPAGQGNRMVLELRSSGSRIDDLLVEILSRAIKVRGGDVQVALGR